MNDDNYFVPGSQIDDDLQKEIDAALGDSSIDELLTAETKPQQPGSAPGLKRGKVVAVHGEDIFVDVGGRAEGVLPVSQFRDEPIPEEGAEIEVQIVGYNDGVLRLSRDGAIEAAAWGTLDRGQVVEGVVTGHNTGGLELKIQSIQAFMPISQIEMFRVEDTSVYVGQKMAAEVIEVKRSEKNVVISRKALLKREGEKNAEGFWQDVHEGKVVEGTVRNIMPYGAFVEIIPGVDGLLHIRDMAHGHVEKPEDIVHTGQKIEVKIVSLDPAEKKIGLGLKQVQPDPWEQVEITYSVGTPCSGRITRLADFGAFIELQPGVEGLIPISEMSFRRINHPKEVIATGDTVRVMVINVDMDRHRIGLSLKQAGDDPWQGAEVRWAVGSTVEGVVTRIMDFGAFVELTAGVEGLVHISQLSDKRVGSVHEVVREGQTVSVRVQEVDTQRRRISLTMKSEGADGPDPAEGTMADLKAVQEKSASQSKKRKGGLDAGVAETPFGELRLG